MFLMIEDGNSLINVILIYCMLSESRVSYRRRKRFLHEA